ncbi:hypothetical protein RIF29_20465 [Crotalaria pallida]|uniref:Uncharacterized protein n=1 Tax=Crotalaria pallida TaxID=3830 RepID=A0AAN9F2L2_CROPI
MKPKNVIAAKPLKLSLSGLSIHDLGLKHCAFTLRGWENEKVLSHLEAVDRRYKGDGYLVRRHPERKGVSGFLSLTIETADVFIANINLLDPHVYGKIFNWINKDGFVWSRVDMVLVSKAWEQNEGVLLKVWPAFHLKEKLKLLKVDIKVSNPNVLSNIHTRIVDHIDELRVLDAKAKILVLSFEEMEHGVVVWKDSGTW